MLGRNSAVSWLGLVAAIACSSDDGTGPDVSATGGVAGLGNGGAAAGGDGNAPGVGGVPGGGVGAVTGVGGSSGGPGCSPYVLDAPEVTGSRESGQAPTMTGGQIVDGKYWLTSMKNYGSRAPYAVADRLDISQGGAYYDEVQRESGIETRDGTSMTVNGTTITFTITCGQFVGTTGNAEYTATPTQFMILPANGVLRTYTKQ